ncbi:MAG: SDR family oxidoreductase [Pseudonocardiaceae bacterium]|nr:SDR family oxidoreductase [Pseudonocardiaceae bacterium]
MTDVVPAADAHAVLPDGVTYLPADTAGQRAVEELLDRCEREVGGLPHAVCCHAGVAASHPVQEFPLDEFDRLVRVNLRGSYVLARAASARWVAAGQPGQLVFTTSWVSDVPWPGIAPYSATKAALKSLTRSFARELAPRGIRANAVAPGIVAVGMAKRQWDTEPDTFLYLLSPLASYVTGSVLVVDGGASLYPMD